MQRCVALRSACRLTAAATMASRPSRADFIKALLAAIDENSGRNYGQLPNDFKATDNPAPAPTTLLAARPERSGGEWSGV